MTVQDHPVQPHPAGGCDVETVYQHLWDLTPTEAQRFLDDVRPEVFIENRRYAYLAIDPQKNVLAGGATHGQANVNSLQPAAAARTQVIITRNRYYQKSEAA